jgi:undecaprenyl-diphosphatase
VLGLALAFWRRSPRPFVLVLLADAAAEGIADALKAIVGSHRPRGYDPLVPVPHSPSFPSGHATVSFACATVLSALAPRAAPFFLVLAAAIAYSRLYVGVHWPLDVVAGSVLGAATALLLLGATRRRSGGRLRRG